MDCKSTTDLKNSLLAAPDLDRFLDENAESFRQKDLPQLLDRILARRHLSKATLAKRSGMSSVYLHQIFSGRRNPSRNRILCLCLGLEATVEEAQALLKHSGLGLLYFKDRRDAIITYGLVHHQTLFEVNDKLFCEGEETLC